jgi:hypothetical protein
MCFRRNRQPITNKIPSARQRLPIRIKTPNLPLMAKRLDVRIQRPWECFTVVRIPKEHNSSDDAMQALRQQSRRLVRHLRALTEPAHHYLAPRTLCGSALNARRHVWRTGVATAFEEVQDLGGIVVDALDDHAVGFDQGERREEVRSDDVTHVAS